MPPQTHYCSREYLPTTWTLLEVDHCGCSLPHGHWDQLGRSITVSYRNGRIRDSTTILCSRYGLKETVRSFLRWTVPVTSTGLATSCRYRTSHGWRESWDMRSGVDWPSIATYRDMIHPIMVVTIDGRIYRPKQEWYDTPCDLRWHSVIHIYASMHTHVDRKAIYSIHPVTCDGIRMIRIHTDVHAYMPEQT